MLSYLASMKMARKVLGDIDRGRIFDVADNLGLFES